MAALPYFSVGEIETVRVPKLNKVEGRVSALESGGTGGTTLTIDGGDASSSGASSMIIDGGSA